MSLEAPGAVVWAVDVNSRALDLTARNAQAHGASGVRVLKADKALAASVESDTRFDVIWSNPPVRIGKEAMHEMLGSWLGRLAPSGVAYLVVQRNLGADSLITWLNGQGFEVSSSRRRRATASSRFGPPEGFIPRDEAVASPREVCSPARVRTVGCRRRAWPDPSETRRRQ